MMARIVPLGRAQPQHLRAISTPPLQNNERFGRDRLQNLRHDDNSVIISHLTMEEYHQLSDTTMDILLESLENLLDVLGRSNYEVEYHVSDIYLHVN